MCVRLQGPRMLSVYMNAHMCVHRCDERWAEYLSNASAASYSYYGEQLLTKFPRPRANKDRDGKSAVRSQHLQEESEALQGPHGGSDLENDQRYMRQLVQAMRTASGGQKGKGDRGVLSAQKLREFVLWAASHPSFMTRLTLVCAFACVRACGCCYGVLLVHVYMTCFDLLCFHVPRCAKSAVCRSIKQRRDNPSLT